MTARHANAIHVLRPGLQTTVQDLGRWGHQARGVAVAGPMDTFSHRVANMLAGNAPSAATLEITLIGPELQFERACTLALSGADFDVSVNGRSIPIGVSVRVDDGARVQFGRRRAGSRVYLAIEGGIDTPLLLGSRATHLVSAMGGLNGRALLTGDILPIAAGHAPRAPRRAQGLALTAGRARLRVLPGPQAEWFTAEAMRAFTGTSFRISPRSNRMGYRLEGPATASATCRRTDLRACCVRLNSSAGRGAADSLDGRQANGRWIREDRVGYRSGSADRGTARTWRLHRVRRVQPTTSGCCIDCPRAAALAPRRREDAMTEMQEQVPLADWCTLGVGGPARWFVRATSETTIVEALNWADAHHVPVHRSGWRQQCRHRRCRVSWTRAADRCHRYRQESGRPHDHLRRGLWGTVGRVC